MLYDGALTWKEMKAVSVQVVSCCVLDKPQKVMHGNSQFMFDYWADLVAHLFLLKSSLALIHMAKIITSTEPKSVFLLNS